MKEEKYKEAAECSQKALQILDDLEIGETDQRISFTNTLAICKSRDDPEESLRLTKKVTEMAARTYGEDS